MFSYLSALLGDKDTLQTLIRSLVSITSRDGTITGLDRVANMDPNGSLSIVHVLTFN